MRKLPSGDIVFPRKGNPPECPDGYYRDKGNPFLFHLDVPDCEYREMKTFVKPCGKLGCYMMCHHFHKEVNSVVCNDCPIPD